MYRRVPRCYFPGARQDPHASNTQVTAAGKPVAVAALLDKTARVSLRAGDLGHSTITDNKHREA